MSVRPVLSPPRSPPHPTIARFFGSQAALLLVLIAVGALAAACGGAAAPDSQPAAATTAPPPPPPPPAAAPSEAPAPPENIAVRAAPPPPDAAITAAILLDEADALERNGFWEAAAEARAALLDGPLAAALRPADYRGALLAHARVLLRLDRYTDALDFLAAVDRAALDTGTVRRLILLDAQAAAGAGDPDTAIEAYTRYLVAGGAAAATARLRRGLLQDEGGRLEEAESDYRAVAGAPDATALEREAALLNLALLLEGQSRGAEAAAHYQRLFDISPWASDRTVALLQLGEIAFGAGDAALGEQYWLRLMQDYPWHWRAGAAYEGLLARGIPVNPLVAGIVLYRQFRSGEARSLFEQHLARLPTRGDAAVSRFFLAALDERAGNLASAVRGYLRAAGDDPQGALADDALWWAARLSEDLGDLTLAGLFYRRLAGAYAASQFATAARFWAGLMQYLHDDLSGAEATWLAAAARDDSPAAQRAWLWVGKSRARRGETADAAVAYVEAITPDPFSYDALRARALLAGEPRAPALATEDLALHDVPAGLESTAWLTSKAGAEDPETWRALQAGAEWRAAIDLHRAGLRGAAAERFRILIARAGADRWLLFRIAEAFHALELLHLQIEAAVSLLATLPAPERPSAPREILAWAYPRGWPALAAHEAALRELDELMLQAMIRQESRFNPDAGSPAGALGLTQVIVPTGEEIAAALGEPEFRPDLLFRPQRSIRYGAFYLAAQLDSFDDAPWIALAAYNGGPGNAFRWAGGDLAIDPDLYFERIDFRETRLYLQLVLENYAWYRFLYRGGEAPGLTSAMSAPLAPPAAENSAQSE